MGLKNEEIHEIIKKKEKSSYITNKLFLDSEFKYLGSNYKVLKDNQEIGEIDGIWYHDNNIFLIEATTKSTGISKKMNGFFNKWEDEVYCEIIRKNFKKNNSTIKRVFFDLEHNSKNKISSREHITRKENNYIIYKDDFEYLNELYDIIGKNVKSELLALFNTKVKKQREPVEAIKVKIGSEFVYVFSLSAKELLRLCYVTRRRGREGYQRRLNKAKINDINKAIRKKDTITFPNSIIVIPVEKIDEVAKAKNKQESCFTKIYLPNSYCSMRVIDGQHRLLGFTNLSDDILKDYHLVVVALDYSTNHEKEVRTFIKINTTQKKVNPNLLLNIRANLDYNEDDPFFNRKIAVLVSRMFNEETDSSLKNKIFFGEVDEKSIQYPLTLTTLVSSLTLSKLVGKNNVFNLRNDDFEGKYSKINLIFKKFTKNRNLRRIIHTNRGIRLIGRILILYYRNFEKKRIKVKINDFINDLFIVLEQDFISELLEYSGIGGAYTAASLVINKLRDNDKYRRFMSDLRYI